MGNESTTKILHNNEHNTNKKGIRYHNNQNSKYVVVSNDGTLKFNFIHNKQMFTSVSTSIQTLKNQLRLEVPNELKGIIFKIERSHSFIKPDNYLYHTYAELIHNTWSDSSLFYKQLFELFKLNKTFYNDTHSFITSWLSGDKISSKDIEHEIAYANTSIDNLNDVVERYHLFKRELEIIEELKMILELTPQMDVSTVAQYDEFFIYKEKAYKEHFCFRDINDFKLLALSVEQLKKFLNVKNDLIDKFNKISKGFMYLYRNIIEQVNKENDKCEIMEELNEFYYLIIKSRYISYIEEKLVQFEETNNFDKNTNI